MLEASRNRAHPGGSISSQLVPRRVEAPLTALVPGFARSRLPLFARPESPHTSGVRKKARGHTDELGLRQLPWIIRSAPPSLRRVGTEQCSDRTRHRNPDPEDVCGIVYSQSFEQRYKPNAVAVHLRLEIFSRASMRVPDQCTWLSHQSPA